MSILINAIATINGDIISIIFITEWHLICDVYLVPITIIIIFININIVVSIAYDTIELCSIRFMTVGIDKFFVIGKLLILSPNNV